MKKLAIIGASGHGKVVADLAEQLGYTVFFFDDAWPQLNKNSRWSVVGNTAAFLREPQGYAGAIIAIGNNTTRKKIALMLAEKNVQMPTLVHPNATVSGYAHIGAGTVVFARTVVNADVRVGQGVILNTGCTVDHDCQIGDYAHVSPGANLAGEVTIGELAWVGIGACVRQQASIGAGAIVGAGAVVVKNVPAGAVVVGSPAKPLVKK